jgi:drug/metabolite transporter (DMT)-like permease
MRISKVQLAILALILTNIIWGASTPIYKWAMQDIQPYTLAFFRFFLAALALLPFTIHRLHVSHRDLLRLLLLAFIGFFVQISSLLFGLTLSSSINAPIISSAAPVFLIIASMLFLKERVKKRIFYGTVVSLLGVMIIILRPLYDRGLDGSIEGNILFVITTIALVMYTVLFKEFRFRYHITTTTFYLFAFAAIIFFPFFLWESTTYNVMQTLDLKGIFGIVFAAFLASVVGYLCYNFAMKYIRASETGVYLYIEPLVTAVIAVPLLGEKITFSFILGSLFVFLGIFLAERHRHLRRAL